MRSGLSCLVAGVLALSVASAAPLEGYSFQPPFRAFDSEGLRTVPNWMFGGTTEVMENYIRLTPDRGNKRGWMWSRKPLDLNEWTLTLQFRVSGQGKRLFGDGFAVWFTTDPYHRDGPVHGFQDKFLGFGLIFDTYVNTEPGHVHKDVMLLTGDGKSSRSAPHGGANDPQAPGCDSDFRYHEGRDDFSAANNRSSVRVSFKDNIVTVAMDPRGTGTWQTCIESAVLPLEAGWFKSGRLGLTASTGQLADNHDMLSLVVTPGGMAEAGTILAELTDAEPDLVRTGQPMVDAAIASSVTVHAAKLKSELEEFEHSLEHELHRVYDSLEHALKKVQDQEAALEKRVADVEARIRQSLSTAVASEVSSKMGATVEQRVAALEDALKRRVADSVVSELGRQLDDKVAEGGSAWILPFAVLAGLLLAFAVYMYRFQRKLKKDHFF